MFFSPQVDLFPKVTQYVESNVESLHFLCHGVPCQRAWEHESQFDPTGKGDGQQAGGFPSHAVA